MAVDIKTLGIKTLSRIGSFFGSFFDTELLITELSFPLNRVIEVGLDLCDHLMLFLANKWPDDQSLKQSI